jgi:ATP-dependent Clp protease adaptor protein ClpS
MIADCGLRIADWRPKAATSPGQAPARTVQTETETKSSVDRPWNVVVWNDPITLMSYVVFVFQKLFGYNREKATKLMLEVHHQGRSVVATVDREKGEYYVSRLHGFGLQATIEQTG